MKDDTIVVKSTQGQSIFSNIQINQSVKDNNRKTSKKNFLLDYVFKNETNNPLKSSGNKLKMAQSYVSARGEGRPAVKLANTNNSEIGRITAKNGFMVKDMSENSENLDVSPPKNFKGDRISIKSKLLQKISIKENGNLKFPKVNPSNLKYQFFDLATRIKENKLKQDFDSTSQPERTYVHCNTYNDNRSQGKSKLQSPIGNLRSINIPNIRSTVLNSSRSNRTILPSNDSPERNRGTTKDSVNIYQVNIEKYLNFSKDNNNNTEIINIEPNTTEEILLSDRTLNKLRIAEMTTTGSNTNINTKNSIFNTQSSTMASARPLIKTQLSFKGIKSPEELHYAGVMFNLEKNKIEKKFDLTGVKEIKEPGSKLKEEG